MTHCGKAVFEVGDTKKTVSVEFDNIAELHDKTDDLTWAHFPAELKVVSIDYNPDVKTSAVKKAA